MNGIFGISQDAFIYDADTYKKIPIYMTSKTYVNPLCCISQGGILSFKKIDDNTTPMKHVVYENDNGLLLGVRVTEDTNVLVFDNEQIYHKKVKDLKIGDILYSNSGLFESNKFKVQSVRNTDLDSIVYTISNDNIKPQFVIVNGISIVV